MSHVEFARHIFSTLTYRPDIPNQWERVSKDFNRYIQEVRRFHHLQIEYLRVVERHSDGRPHIHILLQYPSAVIKVRGPVLSRKSGKRMFYFDQQLYQCWKTLWKYGVSDYQKPLRNNVGVISYCLKYLIKNQTKKTIWKKVFASSAVALESEVETTSEVCAKNTDAAAPGLLKEPPVRYSGVKLATWSRGFDFAVFLARRPESVVKGLKPTEN